MSDARLLDRFAKLCEIPSPTGSEREVGDWQSAELTAAGFDVREDDSEGPARAGCGNRIAHLAGSSDASIMFCVHLDTVPHPQPIEVRFGEDGVFRSAGPTILGADNKAAVAVAVELAIRWSEAPMPPPVGIEIVLSVAEEDGLRGAHALDTSALRSDVGFVMDHATPIGELITAAPTYMRLLADFEGAESHAGMSPEAGVSAIEAAAAAIEAMELGRLSERTTANVGVISGGTATNVVPGHCRVDAEARSLDDREARDVVGRMVDACTWAGSERSADVDCDVWEMFRAYEVPSDSRARALARGGLERSGHTVVERSTGGGSDANALRKNGFDAILLANGTEAPHTPQESVAADRLVEMLAVCDQIVRAAGEGAER
ncbi:M20/M25/M40 family metallo-hydrolase [Thermoleophilia bacterium SCSIO 60948]|nr:M20/M25/M40 family metallo-hydrolase [Thermoleophilia bacterium SCSIO 60948]